MSLACLTITYSVQQRVSVENLPNTGYLGYPGVVGMSSCLVILHKGRSDLFGTQLWRTFSVLVLREIQRSLDPVVF